MVCVQGFEQTSRPAVVVVVVWRRKETRWVRCTARRTQTSEPTLTAFGLAAKRCAECARVNLSCYFLFHYLTGCCAAAASVAAA